MDVIVRGSRLDGAADREVGRARVVGVDAALQADFGGATFPGFAAAALDFVERQVVGAAAQVGGELAFREGAKLTAKIADIGVVDVAVDHISDALAVDGGAQRIRGRADPLEVRTAGREQGHDVGLVKLLAAAALLDNPLHALPPAYRSAA